jgi:hypothetical protein
MLCGAAGGMIHFDMSYWALAKLADPKYGAVGINYRVVRARLQPAVSASQGSGLNGSHGLHELVPADIRALLGQSAAVSETLVRMSRDVASFRCRSTC